MTFRATARLDFQTTTREDAMGAGYVDIYLLPVREERISEYGERATTFGAIVKEYGGLGYREFRADDVGEGFATEGGLTMTAAVAEFDSRAHRDEVMENVMKDPRVVAMTEDEEEQIADMSAMRYGGFETFVAP
jgi:uncharacterized protein YbaA (DUF1428 family)